MGWVVNATFIGWVKGKGKSKVHSRRGNEDPERE
jgi:hypothetical protein